MNMSGLKNKIAQLQQDYYAINNKKTFFKSAQKNDCAAAISSHLDTDELIRHTIYNIPQTNRIYFDYMIFKTFATEHCFERIIDHLMQTTENCIETYGSFEMHVNWNTYTISAHERYKNIYPIFTAKCLQSRFRFSDNLTQMHVYNMPSMIETISSVIRPFIDTKIISKIQMHQKNDSEQRIHNLLHPVR
jgi:hypothetical protein